MTDWWAVTFSAAAAVAALGGSTAAFLQARASTTSAKQAAQSSKDAAGIAANALTQTTTLAAQLAQGGELERWRRDQLWVVGAKMLELSRAHRAAIYRYLVQRWNGQIDDVPVVRAADDAMAAWLAFASLHPQLEMLGSPKVTKAVADLVREHHAYAPHAALSGDHFVAVSDKVVIAEKVYAIAIREDLGLDVKGITIASDLPPLTAPPAQPSSPSAPPNASPE